MSSTSIFIVSILLAATVSLSTSALISKRATTSTITYAQFLGIQIGWTRNQTTQYLNNNAGLVQSEFAFGGIDILTVQYTNPTPYGSLTLLLTNNQLTTKIQAGLNQNQYPISRQQFEAISMGMTTAQVTTLVGSAGQITSQSTNSAITVGYNGNTNAYSSVQITFAQGIVTGKLEVLL
jgi:hypothetical protein